MKLYCPDELIEEERLIKGIKERTEDITIDEYVEKYASPEYKNF